MACVGVIELSSSLLINATKIRKVEIKLPPMLTQ